MKYLFLFIIFFFSTSTVFAACEKDFDTSPVDCSAYNSDSGLCNNTAGCYWRVMPSEQTGGGTVSIDPPLGDATPEELIGRVISAVLGISGSLALLMFIYGGFTWMLSGGNSEKVTKGKNTLVWASIGLVVIFSSYALVNLIFDSLAKGAT